MDGRLERIANGVVVARITLSRRNLATLLARLEDPSQLDRSIWRDVGGGLLVVVSAEEDDAHYIERTPAAPRRGPDARTAGEPGTGATLSA